MDWFFSLLLIAVSAGTVLFTGYLLRRLFTAQPEPKAPATVTASAEPATEEHHD